MSPFLILLLTLTSIVTYTLKVLLGIYPFIRASSSLPNTENSFNFN